ncbi:MAG: bifunctional 5,10-methylenetetrahydrofolate dehydrogenase/5,10-methenyltetrahydrofolate cyclohydrolase [Acholeplasmataceae bacterium]|nr:bifunctional 5,10-methylenetetrahydrofolate dehydrogenase/5,10-methenyltetrahydrofolate cyclohydrolase [Acholeplasmataceae bacterium]
MDGKATALRLEESLKIEVSNLVNKYGRAPKLVVILVGNNPASVSYVKSKEKACKRVGINGMTLRLTEDVSEEQLLKVIDDLNKDEGVDGMIVQLPLPKHIDCDKVLNEIDSKKDVDGLSLLNAGRLSNRQKGLLPATPKGVMMLLEHYKIELKGIHAVVVGASNLVGAPMAKLLINHHATVTVCHIHTKDLKSFTLQADLLVVATGVKNLITGDMVKQGAIVVDVGINKIDGRIYGDVDYESVAPKTSFITPVPGGVGPMTISALIHNVVEAFKEVHHD